MDIPEFGLMLVSIKPDRSPIGLLGKFFFRRQQSWMRRRKIIVAMWCLVVGLVCGGAAIALVLFQNTRK